MKFRAQLDRRSIAFLAFINWYRVGGGKFRKEVPLVTLASMMTR